MSKPQMMMKWSDEGASHPISRNIAAQIILGNRRADPELGVTVVRKYGETYIASPRLGVGLCIFREAGAGA